MEHKLHHQLNLSVSLGEPFLIEFTLILSLSDAILLNVFLYSRWTKKISSILACSRSMLSFVKLYWLKRCDAEKSYITILIIYSLLLFQRSWTTFVSAERGPKC